MTQGVRRAVSEGIGTFFLVLIGTGAVMLDARTEGALGPVGVALATGFVVTAMIYAVGHISGAHINPAVTLAFCSIGRFPARSVPGYLAGQCAGAAAAAAVWRLILGDLADLGVTVPAIPIGSALIVEGLLSFALMFVIVAVATDPRVAGGVAGLAVGLTVAFDVLVGGPLTGASMNPARSFGPALVAGAWSGHWIYWLAPIAGTVAAAMTYEALRPARAPAFRRAGEPLGVQGPISDAKQIGDLEPEIR